MKIPILFSKFIKIEDSMNLGKKITPVVDELYWSSLKNPYQALIKFSITRKKFFDHMGKLESRNRTATIEYKVGLIDFNNINCYSVVAKWKTKSNEKDLIIMKINNTYLNYRIVQRYNIQGKHMVAYSIGETSPIYIKYDKIWWLVIAPTLLQVENFKLLKYNRNADLLEFFL